MMRSENLEVEDQRPSGRCELRVCSERLNPILSEAMEPGEALSTAAQIAVALAGFAGVVVAFRSESIARL
jgi:hypothetical protein